MNNQEPKYRDSSIAYPDRIICVDDDPICLMLEDMVIKQTRFANETLLVGNGNDALVLLNRLYTENSKAEAGNKKSTLILLDINMPGMNGWEFLRILEESHVHLLEKLQIVVLSSSIDQADIEKSKQFKTVRQFISKPLTPEAINSL